MNALLIICGLGIVSLLAEITNLRKWLTALVILGLVAATVVVALDWDTSTRYYHDMIAFDNFSIAFTMLISVVAIFWLWMSGDFFTEESSRTDRSALILFAIAGAVIMVSFHNMSMLFLGIEILSVSLYVLAGSRKDNLFSNEAAFKYFLMGSFATGFLLMGIALVYGATGSFDIAKIGEHIQSNSGNLPGFLYAGVLLMLIGMAFKMSAAPFHFWAPDVYEGSPLSITAFMSTVVKIAAVGAFFRVFSVCFSSVQPQWTLILQVISILTLVIANVTAVFQNSVKRMLAYSSVGHVGYILLAFIASSETSASAIFFYLGAYAIASITAFSVLMVLERAGEQGMIESFNGLFKRNSVAAVAMTVALLSLAGIPPLAGFFGKYMVFALAIDHGYIGLVIVAIVTSLIGVFYYFRVIIAMFFKEGDKTGLRLQATHRLLIVLLMVLNLALGVFPDAVISLLGY